MPNPRPAHTTPPKMMPAPADPAVDMVAWASAMSAVLTTSTEEEGKRSRVFTASAAMPLPSRPRAWATEKSVTAVLPALFSPPTATIICAAFVVTKILPR